MPERAPKPRPRRVARIVARAEGFHKKAKQALAEAKQAHADARHIEEGVLERLVLGTRGKKYERKIVEKASPDTTGSLGKRRRSARQLSREFNIAKRTGEEAERLRTLVAQTKDLEQSPSMLTEIATRGKQSQVLYEGAKTEQQMEERLAEVKERLKFKAPQAKIIELEAPKPAEDRPLTQSRRIAFGPESKPPVKEEKEEKEEAAPSPIDLYAIEQKVKEVTDRFTFKEGTEPFAHDKEAVQALEDVLNEYVDAHTAVHPDEPEEEIAAMGYKMAATAMAMRAEQKREHAERRMVARAGAEERGFMLGTTLNERGVPDNRAAKRAAKAAEWKAMFSFGTFAVIFAALAGSGAYVVKNTRQAVHGIERTLDAIGDTYRNLTTPRPSRQGPAQDESIGSDHTPLSEAVENAYRTGEDLRIPTEESRGGSTFPSRIDEQGGVGGPEEPPRRGLEPPDA